MDFYLSDLLNDPVFNQTREKIGNLLDFVVADINKPRPVINGLVVRRGLNKEMVFIPKHDVAEVSSKLIKLATDIVNLAPFVRRNGEVLLVNDVYDKQIVDIDDRRITRVNDLLLEENHEFLRLKGVDVSATGIIKRLKIPIIDKFFKRNVVNWEDVQFLGGSAPMKFNLQYQNLQSLHPVDIARIIFEGPGYKQGSRVLSALEEPLAADIIEELSPQLQRNLIESMNTNDVASVIEHMPAHKAADLLVAMGSDYSIKILPLINTVHRDAIKSLLNYPESSTGAYMVTEYIAVSAAMTIDELFNLIRNRKNLPDFLLYFYVLENKFSNKLVGVISSYELYTADLRSRVESLMIKDLIISHPHDLIKDSLKKMYRYNLSALPVLSSENKLLGIVTFRDAISVYLPKRWKMRMSHFYTA